MRAWGIATVVLTLCLVVSGAFAAELKSELPLKVESTAPAVVLQSMPKGMQTWVCARTTVGDIEYVFHVFYPKPVEGDGPTGPAQMDIYSMGDRPTLLHHVNMGGFTVNLENPHQLALIYLRPGRKMGPMLVFSQGTRDLAAVIFAKGFYQAPRYEHWSAPEAATYSYEYEVGPVDTKGYRAIRVRYSEMGGKPQVVLRHWIGDRYEIGQ